MFYKILIYLLILNNNVLMSEQLFCFTCFNTTSISSKECLKTECYESINSIPICQVYKLNIFSICNIIFTYYYYYYLLI